jgi:hypothetical protein
MFERFERCSLARRIERALAPNLRYEVRSDGLELRASRTRLAVGWCARDVHPWDNDLQANRKAAAFVRQCIDDTDAAITRLFAALPQVDELDIPVIDRQSDRVIIRGEVRRSDLSARPHTSPRMRLIELGLSFKCDGAHFESLPVGGPSSPETKSSNATIH